MATSSFTPLSYIQRISIARNLMTLEKVFAAHNLIIFDVEELPTHGGSLCVYARHAEDASKPIGAQR